MTDPRPGTIRPTDLQPLPPVDWTALEELPGIVEGAREAQKAWAALSTKERGKRLIAVAKRILERRDEAIALLSDEMGRSAADSLLGEIAFVLDYARGAVKVGQTSLAPVPVRLSPINFPGKRVVVEAVPRGVIAIIEPWNYPLLQFYKPLFPALLSGNAVVMKPSEHTPRCGVWLAEQFAAVLGPDVVRVVIGDGELGAALVDSAIDAVVFCGSVATGRRVAMRCAERLIPCSIELGGKDAAIVLEDCDLERTVAGILQWSMHNAGQDCSSIERIFVEASIADSFVRRLAAAADRLTVSPTDDADIGPLQNATQLAIVETQVQAALGDGATLVAGGERTGSGYGYRPTVLDHCTPDMQVLTDETFGPVAAIVRVDSAEDAIRLANAGRYGLCGSVWTRDTARGERIARELEVGLCLVNNHSFPGSLPQVPWTGTKQTGTGTAASPWCYDTFVRRQTIIVDKASKPDVFWKPVDANLLALGHAASELALGALGRIITLLPLLGRRVRSIRQLTEE